MTHSLVEDFVLNPKEQNLPSFWIRPLDTAARPMSNNSHSAVGRSYGEKQQLLGEPQLAITLEQAVINGVSEFKGGGDTKASVSGVNKTPAKGGKMRQKSASNSSAMAAELGDPYRMSLARKAMSVWMKRHTQRGDGSLRQAPHHNALLQNQATLQFEAPQDGSFTYASFNDGTNYAPKTAMDTDLNATNGVLNLPVNAAFQSPSPSVPSHATQTLVSSTGAATTPSAKKKKWKRPSPNSGGVNVNRSVPSSQPVNSAAKSGQGNVTEWGGVMKWLGWYREKVDEYKQTGEEVPLCKRVYRDKIGQEAEAAEKPKKKKSKKKRHERQHDNLATHGIAAMRPSNMPGNNTTFSALNNGIGNGTSLGPVWSSVNGTSHVAAAQQVNVKQLPLMSISQQQTVNMQPSTNGAKGRTFVKTPAMSVDNRSSYGQQQNNSAAQMIYSLGNYAVGGVSSADVREAANADNLVPTVPSDDVSKVYGSAPELALLASIQGVGSIDQDTAPVLHKPFPMDSMGDLSWDGCLPSPPAQLNNYSSDVFHGRAELPSDIVSSFVSFDSPFHLLLEAASLPRNSIQQAAPPTFQAYGSRTFVADGQSTDNVCSSVSMLNAQDGGQYVDRTVVAIGFDTPTPIASYSTNRCVAEEEAQLWYDLPAPLPASSLSDDDTVDAADEATSCFDEVATTGDFSRDIDSSSCLMASEMAAMDGTCLEPASAESKASQLLNEQGACVDDCAASGGGGANPADIALTSSCVVRHYASSATYTVSMSRLESRVLVTGPYSRWK
jgi:hypothetical protein